MLELLESRIAPAAMVNFNNAAKMATWQDFDGDTVTLKWTTGAPTFTFTAPANTIDPDGTVIEAVNFSGATHANDAITVSVKAGATGDGHVALGYINGTGAALKSFTAPAASVLEFDCGDGTHAIGSFSVNSYGTLPASAFPSAGGDGTGVFNGAVGSVKIAGDFDYGNMVLGGDGSATTNLTVGSVTIGGSLHGDVSQSHIAGALALLGPAGSVKIGGSMIGGSVPTSGTLIVAVSLKSVSVAHNLVGGTGQDSGEISPPSGFTADLQKAISFGTISVAGSVIGSEGVRSGSVIAGTVKSITVNGNVQGGHGQLSGLVAALGDSGSITVKQSVLGGSGQASGNVEFVGTMKSVSIGHDIIGGVGQYSGSVGPEVLHSNPAVDEVVVTSLSVGGSVVGGSGPSSGELEGEKTARIFVGGDVRGGASSSGGIVGSEGPVGSIVVAGDVIGGQTLNPTFDGFSGVIVASEDAGSITIGHSLVTGTTTHTDAGSTHVSKSGAVLVEGNLGSLTIGGDVEGSNATRAFIVAQGDLPSAPGNFNGIGKISIKGSVNYAIIATGYDIFGNFSSNLGAASEPDAGIGSVSIGHDYYHSSIMAGINDLDRIGVGRTTGGVSDDTKTGNMTGRVAILGPVTIKGALLDDSDALGDSGFEAQEIVKISVSGHTVFTTGSGPRFLDSFHFILAQEITPP